ncbi:MAG: ATP-binding protein [Pseudomonadota bacterium]
MAEQQIVTPNDSSFWKGSWRSTIEELPNIVWLILAVLVGQAIFWIILKPIVIGSLTPSFATIEGVDFETANLEAPTLDAVQQAQFEVLEELPGWHCCESGYRALRYAIVLDEVPPTGIGIVTGVRADNYMIYANGHFVAGEGRMTLPDHTFHTMRTQAHQIAAPILTEGRNQVTVIMVRDGIPYFDYYPPAIGEFLSVQDNMQRTEFLTHDYEFLLLSALTLVSVFALIFFWISGFDRSAFWLFLLSGALALTTHYYGWFDPPFNGQIRITYFIIISMLVHFAWFGWADAWSRKTYRWILPIAFIVFAVAIIVIIAALAFLPSGKGYDLATSVLHNSGIAFSIATTLRLLWSFRDLEERRFAEAAIALLLMMLFAIQAFTELTQALNFGYAVRMQPFLIIGIAAAFFARRVTLFRSSAQINALLQDQLDERTAELATAHKREKELVRQQALDEERQRIMRDMHDGLGSHMMSLMMMARRGKGEPADFAEGLQSVIDEMRLMIVSMDSVGDSLRAGLTVFRKRVLARAKEAGVLIRWEEDDGITFPTYSPSEVLQIFRILQEAVTNALKHSHGNEIAVQISETGQPADSVLIAITDNGDGFDAVSEGQQPLSRRGLRNMRQRAEAIGAGLEVTSSDAGTGVNLVLSGDPS